MSYNPCVRICKNWCNLVIFSTEGILSAGGATNNSQASRSGSMVACPRVPTPARPPLAAAAP